MDSLEVFGIKKEKSYIEELLNSNIDVIKNQHIKVHDINDQIIMNDKDELILTDKLLGKGTYGTVILGLIINKENRIEKKEVAVKIPDKEINLKLYNLLIENTIHGLLTLNKEIQEYIPKLNYFFYEPNDENIITIMEKLDGTINDIFKKYRKDGNKKIYDKFVLSYILQISYAIYRINQNNYVFSHRDLKPNNTGFNIIKAGSDLYDMGDYKFVYPNFGYRYKIIDFGLSCIEYKDRYLSRESLQNNVCKSFSRDITNFIFVFLNYNYKILSNEIIVYFGYLLDFTDNCKLWIDFTTKTNIKKSNIDDNLDTHCSNIEGIDRYLKDYIYHPEFDNSKTYPESIIKDISQDILPYSSEAVDYYQSLTK